MPEIGGQKGRIKGFNMACGCDTCVEIKGVWQQHLEESDKKRAKLEESIQAGFESTGKYLAEEEIRLRAAHKVKHDELVAAFDAELEKARVKDAKALDKKVANAKK